MRLTAGLGFAERNHAEVDRLASDLIELSTRHNFLHFLAIGTIIRGWARSASGNKAEAIPGIEQGIKDLRATGSVLGLATDLALKAEALYLADRASEALERAQGWIRLPNGRALVRRKVICESVSAICE